MEKKKLTISVSGGTNTGKSRMILLLKNFLRENDFNVELDGGIDFISEKQFDDCVSKNFEQVVDNIKKDRKIILKEVQDISIDYFKGIDN